MRHSVPISACIASSEIAWSLFWNARSISPASLIASAESPVATTFGFVAPGLVSTGLAETIFFTLAAGRRAGLAATLGDDIQLVPFFQHLVFFQLHLPVGNALAGLHVVFHAVPGADEVHLGRREGEAER